SKVQQEIGKEFAAMIASGTIRATEAAACSSRANHMHGLFSMMKFIVLWEAVPLACTTYIVLYCVIEEEQYVKVNQADGEKSSKGRQRIDYLSLPDIKLFRYRKPLSVRCSAGDSTPTDFDAKVFRHNLTRSENYNRKGFGHKKETMELMNQEYTNRYFWSLESEGDYSVAFIRKLIDEKRSQDV
nr:4-hydroxy-3-methylbut-2-enyl diphosphate reductase, chloroplastic-like [Tanacetum cinerariifolium]